MGPKPPDGGKPGTWPRVRARWDPKSALGLAIRARAILNLATSPTVEGQTGLYFNGLREAKAQAQAYEPDARRRLRASSLELTGLPAEGVAALER
jgi:hypothetical protein